MSVRTTILAAAAVAATMVNIGVAAAPALAQGSETIAVSYADLNLASDVGRNVLDRRIASAAGQLCGQALLADLGDSAAVRACLDATIASVQPQRDAVLGNRYGTVQISQAGGGSIRVSRAAN